MVDRGCVLVVGSYWESLEAVFSSQVSGVTEVGFIFQIL